MNAVCFYFFMQISALNFDSLESLLLAELNISKNKLTTFPGGLDIAYPHLTKLNVSR